MRAINSARIGFGMMWLRKGKKGNEIAASGDRSKGGFGRTITRTAAGVVFFSSSFCTTGGWAKMKL